ncbi:hypothetical protein [Nonomuraea sp. NPDC050540]|uniref:hypothetical protein n=1 Tax=Nonomuraea sp. NPDC050540 TaxID=3364367 RepID=UPI0037944AC0
MVSVISIVTAHVAALTGVWLRLRWRARHTQIQGRCLVQLAQAAPGRGRLDLEEQHGQAHRLTLTLTTASGTGTPA